MDLRQNSLKCGAKYYGSIKEIKSPDIYSVEYSASGHRFALKRIQLVNCEDIEFYENEIILTNRLRHINIMPYLSSFVNNSEMWQIMPLALGSVKEFSTPNGLSEETIAFVIQDVLNAVQYLHENFIIHRGIQSCHILVMGSLKTCIKFQLSGFKYSISCLRDREIKSRIFDYPTHADNILNHMSPEMMEQNLMGYDYKSDIYSIGSTCCELANGCQPYEGLEKPEILLHKLNGETPRPFDSNSKDVQELAEEEKSKPLEGLTPEMKLRFERFKRIKYSKEFMDFTTQSCLHHEPDKRWNSTELLSHPFIKMCENLDKTSVLDQYFSKSLIN